MDMKQLDTFIYLQRLSVKTVNHHVSKIILKLEAVNRTHAVAKALVAKYIEMRTADTPIRILNRRLGEQNKMARVIASNMPESAGCEAFAG